MSTTLELPRKLEHDAVAHLARQLWEEQGRPAGRDLEFWVAAEARLREPRTSTPPPLEPTLSIPTIRPKPGTTRNRGRGRIPAAVRHA